MGLHCCTLYFHLCDVGVHHRVDSTVVRKTVYVIVSSGRFSLAYCESTTSSSEIVSEL